MNEPLAFISPRKRNSIKSPAAPVVRPPGETPADGMPPYEVLTELFIAARRICGTDAHRHPADFAERHTKVQLDFFSLHQGHHL
jgi:hypothetical protein